MVLHCRLSSTDQESTSSILSDINDLAERVRLGVAHLVGATAPLSYGKAYASRHVYREMYQPDKLGNANKFEKLARQSQVEGWGRSADVFQRVFESEYLPVIRFEVKPSRFP